ncbi:hypothetical protein [Breznakiella homolactica]|uniref:Uncharacterized protein n=1 Tax=Breznakiella homolactica TaxID=2798577 RepID=A0A7T8BA19_9SPIR|nr:hypothetical protein [Breznakiella homolactica]QQO10204.1 hypothetical protein JFL75_04585 [Breznakiella homolactica]
MPLPKPDKATETKEEFISRCIEDLTKHKSEEFPARAQRAAVCYSQWGETKEERRKYEEKKRKKAGK